MSSKSRVYGEAKLISVSKNLRNWGSRKNPIIERDAWSCPGSMTLATKMILSLLLPEPALTKHIIQLPMWMCIKGENTGISKLEPQANCQLLFSSWINTLTWHLWWEPDLGKSVFWNLKVSDCPNGAEHLNHDTETWYLLWRPDSCIGGPHAPHLREFIPL